MTKMAAMPVYIMIKMLQKSFFSGTGGPISTKLGMLDTKVLQCVDNHDPVMKTYFTVTYAFG